jgi:hypothetical protein
MIDDDHLAMRVILGQRAIDCRGQKTLVVIIDDDANPYNSLIAVSSLLRERHVAD